MAEALEDGVGHRSGPLPPPDADRGGPARRSGGRPVRAVQDPVRHAAAVHLPVPVADLVSDALASADALARARGVRLVGQPIDPIVVRADGRELSRVLTNLVINAIRHTPVDGTVAVLAGPSADGAVLEVTDGCGGIPEPDLARLFDVGWRGTPARTPGPDGGTGLGLAIARGIVEAHDGSLTVANAGRGCRFQIHLPNPGIG